MPGKILVFFFLLIFTTTKSIAQIEFVKGYFINSSNQRIDCLIKNNDWKDNPTEFTYKLSENADAKSANLNEIKEFSVGESLKYISATIKIDRSSAVISKLSSDRNPIWLDEKQFLKIVVEGKISLLAYTKGNLSRYFYYNGDTIVQLIYKKYFAENMVAKTNNSFQQQLLVNFTCGNVTDNIRQLKYNILELKKYFIKYNECMGDEIKDYIKQENGDSFHLRASIGINQSYSSLIVYPQRIGDFDSQLSARFGVETEYVLTFNKNKWSIIVEPNYQSYKSNLKAYSVEYNSFEIPVGLRYYMFLNRDSRFFINTLMGKSFPIKSFMEWNNIERLGITPSLNISAGLGYNYKRISGELRYYMNKDLLNEYQSLTARYNRLSFILSIKVF